MSTISCLCYQRHRVALALDESPTVLEVDSVKLSVVLVGDADDVVADVLSDDVEPKVYVCIVSTYDDHDSE